MAETKSPTKVVLGSMAAPVRFSYAHVFKAVKIAEDSETLKFSVSILIPKKDKAGLKAVRAAIEAAKELGKAKLGKIIESKFKTPLRDGDEDRPDDEAYAGCYFLNATANTRPTVVDKNVQPILDENDFKSGDYGRVSVNFFAFNTNGNKGVGCGLNNVQKLKDGESLTGRSSAEEDFGIEEDDEEDEPAPKPTKKAKKPAVEEDDDDDLL